MVSGGLSVTRSEAGRLVLTATNKMCKMSASPHLTDFVTTGNFPSKMTDLTGDMMIFKICPTSRDSTATLMSKNVKIINYCLSSRQESSM